MSHKHVGPIGWEFSGDKARCFQLIGPTRLLVQQALKSIDCRGGDGFQHAAKTHSDGSASRVSVIKNGDLTVIRASIYGAGMSCKGVQLMGVDPSWAFRLLTTPSSRGLLTFPIPIQYKDAGNESWEIQSFYSCRNLYRYLDINAAGLPKTKPIYNSSVGSGLGFAGFSHFNPDYPGVRLAWSARLIPQGEPDTSVLGVEIARSTEENSPFLVTVMSEEERGKWTEAGGTLPALFIKRLDIEAEGAAPVLLASVFQADIQAILSTIPVGAYSLVLHLFKADGIIEFDGYCKGGKTNRFRDVKDDVAYVDVPDVGLQIERDIDYLFSLGGGGSDEEANEIAVEIERLRKRILLMRTVVLLPTIQIADRPYSFIFDDDSVNPSLKGYLNCSGGHHYEQRSKYTNENWSGAQDAVSWTKGIDAGNAVMVFGQPFTTYHTAYTFALRSYVVSGLLAYELISLHSSGKAVYLRRVTINDPNIETAYFAEVGSGTVPVPADRSIGYSRYLEISADGSKALLVIAPQYLSTSMRPCLVYETALPPPGSTTGALSWSLIRAGETEIEDNSDAETTTTSAGDVRTTVVSRSFDVSAGVLIGARYRGNTIHYNECTVTLTGEAWSSTRTTTRDCVEVSGEPPVARPWRKDIDATAEHIVKVSFGGSEITHSERTYSYQERGNVPGINDYPKPSCFPTGPTTQKLEREDRLTNIVVPGIYNERWIGGPVQTLDFHSLYHVVLGKRVNTNESLRTTPYDSTNAVITGPGYESIIASNEAEITDGTLSHSFTLTDDQVPTIENPLTLYETGSGPAASSPRNYFLRILETVCNPYGHRIREGGIDCCFLHLTYLLKFLVFLRRPAP